MKLIKLFLLFGLIFNSFLVMAQTPTAACIGKDQEVAPPVPERTTTDSNGNTVDTQKYADWKNGKPDWMVRKDWNCCDKLEKNASTRICEDKSMVDPKLKKCSGANAHGECDGDLGCLAFDEDHMFKETPGMTPAEKEDLRKKQVEFDKARDEVDPRPNGGFCYRNVECESYSCSAFRCQPNYSCRLAGVADPATPPKVKCEAPYVKDALNKCVDPNAAYFKGLLGEIVVTPVPGPENQCQFQLVPTAQGATKDDVRKAINLAIITTRGLEWLMSTTSQDRDCTYSMDFFRDRITKLIEDRKKIIKDYNVNFKNLEANFQLINTAKKDNQQPVATLCDGEVTTQHDIAMRKASGLDFLCYMKARNQAFMLYEAKMFEWSKEINAMMEKYRSNVAGWGENDKNWTIGDEGKNWKDARTCRYWVNLLVDVWTPKKIKKRWEERYYVSYEGGASVFKNKMLQDYFAMVGDSDTAGKMEGGGYRLLDPLLPGNKGKGMSFKDWGSAAFSIEGSGHDRDLTTKTLHDMHGKYKDRIVEFLKSLRTDVPEGEFIAEPDIPSSFEQRGCLNKIDSPDCKGFRDYVGQLQDVAFAQMISYSHHTQRKYKSYYKTEGATRNKLMTRFATDSANLGSYYVALADLRKKQNECIDRVITQLRGSEFDGKQQGLAQGNSNYYQPTETDFTGLDSSDKNVNKPKIKKGLGVKPFQFSITSQKGFKDSVNKDGMGSFNEADLATFDAEARAAMAARNKAMSDTNAAAVAKGIDVKKMESEFKDTLRNSAALGGGGAGSSSRGGSSAASMSSGDISGNKATIGDDAAKTDAMSSTGKDGKANAGAGAGVGTNAGALSGIVGGAGSGDSGAGAGAGVPHQDPTGMSDEEKDMMARNIDRNKSQYNPKEDDSLFQVVSKTYVRNLDKILTRKKKLDEDSASYPSTPSTP